MDPDNFANTTVCPENECYSNNLPSGVQVREILSTWDGSKQNALLRM